jgi:hypothetical protein
MFLLEITSNRAPPLMKYTCIELKERMNGVGRREGRKKER